MYYTLSHKSTYTSFVFSTESEFEGEPVELHKQMIPHFLAIDVGSKTRQAQL